MQSVSIREVNQTTWLAGRVPLRLRTDKVSTSTGRSQKRGTEKWQAIKAWGCGVSQRESLVTTARLDWNRRPSMEGP